MKKLILLLIIGLTMILFGCQTDQTYSVIVPNGSPSIGQSYMEYHSNDHNFNIERVNGPQPLVAAFTSESHDIIIAPINLGANMYQKGSPYQLAGVLTWTNLQIISRFEITELNQLSGEDIIAFGEGAVPEMIIDYIFEMSDLNQEVNVQYSASSPQESFLSFMQNEQAIAIVSEPVTSTALESVDPLYILDLAEVWGDLTNEGLFPQAGVFIHSDLPKEQAITYLTHLQESAVLANLNSSQIAMLCEEMDYPFDKEIIETSILLSKINFQSVDYAMSAIESFINRIYEFKPELIGNAIPDDDWYYPLS